MLLKSGTKTMLLSGASLGTCVVSQVYLLLCSRHFFNEDPGHCGPACVCVSKCMAIIAVSNPESHSHSSLVNVIAVSFNLTVTVKVFASCCCHIVRAINSTRRATLSAIECEIPTTAAVVTGSNAKVTSEVDMESRLCIILHELTALPQGK